MAGLQGSGKTTATAKLARYLREQNNSSVAVAACDVYRPAAVEQLVKVGAQAGATVYEQGTDRNPVDIAALGARPGQARRQGRADRRHLAAACTSTRTLMKELADIKKRDQAARRAAGRRRDDRPGRRQRRRAVRRGRAVRRRRALQARRRRPRRRRAVGQGGHRQADPVRLHRREAAATSSASTRTAWRSGSSAWATSCRSSRRPSSSVDEDEAKELERKLRKNQFTLEDFLDQLKRIRKMGPLTSLLGMIPGLAGHQLSKMKVDEKEFDRVEAIILSMTPLRAPRTRRSSRARGGCGSPRARAPRSSRSTSSSSSSARCAS